MSKNTDFRPEAGFCDNFDFTSMAALEDGCRLLAESLGASRCELPVVENADLFNRGTGEADAVKKEMFYLTARDASMVLRPEGTVQSMRAWLASGGTAIGASRKYYISPMFRNERQQAGRFKQFRQFGLEFIGIGEGLVDIDVISATDRFISGIVGKDAVSLKINYIGTPAERLPFVAAVRDWAVANIEALAPKDRERVESNPLRILDSKEPSTVSLLDGAPSLGEWLSPESRAKYGLLADALVASGIKFSTDERLVRGLDYYSGLVFEWVTSENKAQNAIGAGGRYDGLSSAIGGPQTPAMGLALGMERLLALSTKTPREQPRGAYLVWTGETLPYAASVAMAVRNLGMPVTVGPGGKFSRQLSEASKIGARFAIIIGGDEMLNGTVSIKNLLTTEQETVPLTLISQYRF